MAEIKTKPTKASAAAFLKTIEPKQKRDDALALLALYQKITGQKPVMWGTAMIGFGMYHYESERSTQKGDWPLVAFAPRKQALTLYILPYKEEPPALLKKLGKFKTGGGCLYINKLADVDIKVLEKLIEASYERMKKKYGA